MSHALHEIAPAGGSRSGQVLGALTALALHAAVTLAAFQCQPTQASAPLVVTEVDLTPVELPAPEPEPARPPEPTPEPEKAPAPAPRAEPRAAKHAPPPPAAAGALHTAREDAPEPSEPVRFAVDANGGAYGFGVVAAGGSRSGQAGGVGPASAAPTPSPTPAALAPAERPRAFAVPPRLDESDPCRGFFPSGAGVDRGEVTVTLRIAADGAVQRVSVQSEQPADQGFGASAVRCLKAKRFVPARDENGRDVIAEAPVTVRFSR